MDAPTLEPLQVAAASREYDIVFASPTNGAADLSRWIRTQAGERTRAVVVDEQVARVQPTIVDTVTDHGRVAPIVIPSGEHSKSMAELDRVLRAFVTRGVPRDGVVIAVGGGVVGDLAGFAAAVHLRGVDFLQIPTTLLAMVDSAVGGKTGINLEPLGKNLAGAFHQPCGVFVDPALLSTLPAREFRAALGEVAKYAVLDRELMRELLAPVDPREQSLAHALAKREPAAIARVVRECLALKADVVAADERETSGVREALNLGHTLGHALEAAALATRDGADGADAHTPHLLHGEAVALGLDFALALSLAATATADLRAHAADAETLLRTFEMARSQLRDALPTTACEASDLRAFMAVDKKRRDYGGVRFVLPTASIALPRTDSAHPGTRTLLAQTTTECTGALADVNVDAVLTNWLASSNRQ